MVGAIDGAAQAAEEAIPIAPPSSVQVSRIPDTAPERSGGAAATVISVVITYTGARPMENTIAPSTSSGSPECESSCVSSRSRPP